MSQSQGMYRINLIRELRDREKKSEKQKSLAVTIGVACFIFFLISLLYSGFTMWRMENVIGSEQLKLTRLKQEYNKYKVTQLIVDKSDIELLNELQGRGMLWTRKLATMAKHLPDNYWITRFSYANNELRVTGYGYIPPNQDQLLVIDSYLNSLRIDTSFTDQFPHVQLNSAQRTEENGNSRVAFDFSAFTTKWKGQ